MLAGACAAPSYTYVKDPAADAIFKLPRDWTVYDQTQIYRHSNPNATEESAVTATSGEWLVGFDASSTPSLNHLLDSTAADPTGFAKVRPVTSAEHTTFASPTALRNLVINLDQNLKAHPDLVKVVSSQTLHLPGGFKGLRVTFGIRSDTSSPYFTINQTALVDATVQKLYMLVIACQSSCYLQSQRAIDQVVESWTVKRS